MILSCICVFWLVAGIIFYNKLLFRILQLESKSEVSLTSEDFVHCGKCGRLELKDDCKCDSVKLAEAVYFRMRKDMAYTCRVCQGIKPGEKSPEEEKRSFINRVSAIANGGISHD